MTGEPEAFLSAAGSRGALVRLLVGVPPARLAAVARDVFRLTDLPPSLSWRDTAAVIDHIADLPAGPDGRPPLLIFATHVAAELTGPTAAEVAAWVAAAAAETGFEGAAIGSRVGLGTARDAPETRSDTKPKISVHNTLDSDPSSRSGVGAVVDRSVSTLPQPGRASVGQRDVLRIWGGVPLRNSAFTGRETLLLQLQRALERRSKASVLPQALHGMGGVGKTQLAVEFAYRFADRYDVVWWIPAEQRSLVLQSLSELGQRIGVPGADNLQQAANLVRDALAESRLRWLLVYDNANDPEDIASLIPPAGGHVILTSRNQTWSEVWDPIEVDVFDRRESVELVRKRGRDISESDADRLAGRLGDLPLALDQAASCQAATGMPVNDYLARLDQHVRELSQDKGSSYRTTIAALVRLALHLLREAAPATAQLLEMFAHLGAEPISDELLQRGREARVSEPLGTALRNQLLRERVIRDLRRYGLAKVDPYQRIQVHRLFQLVLRDELSEDLAERSRGNVHHLFASANPGDPEGHEDIWPIHAEIGPHIEPAGLLNSDLLHARSVVLDQIRYLYLIGDHEGSRRLGEAAVDAWAKVEAVPRLGPDGELTLIATRHLASALRSLGFYERARSLSEDTLDRLQRSTEFGPDHEHTLATADHHAPNLRVAGLFREALRLDRDNLDRHRRIYGDDDPTTLKVQLNLAVNLRMLSDFPGAYDIDAQVVRTWQQTVSENDNRLLFAQANLARDLYGLGRYVEALELQEQILPPYREQLGAEHPYVLWAGRTLAITLRKMGRYAEALSVAEQHCRAAGKRYGSEHEHSLAAAMTFANTLHVNGHLPEADRLASEAVDRYLRVFGEKHPLSLAAAVNHAIILRASGERARARELDERTLAQTTRLLGAEHGYTLCVANNLANDLVAGGDLEAAMRQSGETFAASRRFRGERHPYTLSCATNAALDLIAVGQEADGQALLDETVAMLGDVLGADHPETMAARNRQRAECDIEPPPT